MTNVCELKLPGVAFVVINRKHRSSSSCPISPKGDAHQPRRDMRYLRSLGAELVLAWWMFVGCNLNIQIMFEGLFPAQVSVAVGSSALRTRTYVSASWSLIPLRNIFPWAFIDRSDPISLRVISKGRQTLFLVTAGLFFFDKEKPLEFVEPQLKVQICQTSKNIRSLSCFSPFSFKTSFFSQAPTLEISSSGAQKWIKGIKAHI